MSKRFTPWSAVAVASMALASLFAGCAVGTDGYVYDSGVNVGVGLDYYEPFGFDYGGWGPGYGVGPYRGGGHRPERGGGTPGHSYRPAPPTHPVPGIPSGPRPGGGRPGGAVKR